MIKTGNPVISIYTEMTPNPETMKFVANKYLLPTGASVEFENKAAAKGYSPLAEALFDFPFVTKVFMGPGFDEYLTHLKKIFGGKNIKTFKPKSCRKESKEIYVIKV